MGMNPSRTGVLEVLAAMGARVERRAERVEAAEPVADLGVASSALHATEIGGELIPRVIDELPILAVAALAAAGLLLRSRRRSRAEARALRAELEARSSHD